MIKVSYHRTVKVLQEANKKSSPHDGPFGRAEWFALLVDSGAAPLVLCASDGQNTAALPLTRANGRIEPLINWYSFTWGPLGSGTPDLLRAIATELRNHTHRVTLWPVADDSGSASLLETAFRASGWSVRRETCDHNHILEVQGRSFDEYWAGRSGAMRTTLKRKAKHVTVTILDQFDAAIWAEYEKIYQKSWKPAEGNPSMLRAFAEQEGAAGRIRLALARHKDVPVAAQFWTVENGTAYIHKLAHLENHKSLSAGTTLTAALFKHVIDQDRVNLVNFGTGNDPYKRDWMELDRPRYRLDCLDPRKPASWLTLIKRLIGQ